MGSGASGRDQAEAERFAEALARLESGSPPAPDETGEFAELTAIAARLRAAAEASTTTARYRSYQRCARGSVLSRLPRVDEGRAHTPVGGIRRLPALRRSALVAVAGAAAAAAIVLAVAPLAERSGGMLGAGDQVAGNEAPAPVRTTAAASAASASPELAPTTSATATAPAPEQTAAAAAVVATPTPAPTADPPASQPAELGTGGADGAGGDLETAGPADSAPAPTPTATPAPTVAPIETPTPTPDPAPAVVLTPYGTIAEQLAHIDDLLTAIADDVENARPIPRETLRGLSESLGTLAYRIEAEPDAVDTAHVVTFLHQAAESWVVLAAAEVDDPDNPALAAARRVAQDGVVTVSGYLQYR